MMRLNELGPARHPAILDVTTTDFDAIREINAAAVPAVSVLTPGYFEQLLRECTVFSLIQVEERTAGYACAMPHDATYDGVEFQWFRARFLQDFLYIDQVAIDRNHREKGLGRALYGHLEEYATRNRVSTLVCEVNHDPCNSASQAFHKRCGFVEAGRMKARGVVVSLLAKQLG